MTSKIANDQGLDVNGLYGERCSPQVMNPIHNEPLLRIGNLKVLLRRKLKDKKFTRPISECIATHCFRDIPRVRIIDFLNSR